MAEDRFRDLGNGRPADAADRLTAEPPGGGATGPERPPRRPEVTVQGNRYAWAVAIVALMGIAVLLFTTALPNAGQGLQGPEPGTVVPDFAARLATAPFLPGEKEEEVDANVCQRPTECNEDVGNVPACTLHGHGFFNVCDARRRPLVLTFVFDEGAECNPQVDRVERMKDDVPGVGFAVVYFSEEERLEVAEIVRRRKWTMPVAHTPDGAVVNLYNVGGCPTTVFAAAGGRVRETVLGPISEDELRRRARRLLGS
jgi:hypothetical protein